MKFALTALAATIALSSNAALASAICTNVEDHATEKECLSAAAKRSDADVRAAQAQLLKKIQNWVQDPEFRTETLRRFQVSVAEYFKWRNAQCEYSRSLAAGGNGAGDMALECQVELDREYLRYIHQMDDGFDRT